MICKKCGSKKIKKEDEDFKSNKWTDIGLVLVGVGMIPIMMFVGLLKVSELWAGVMFGMLISLFIYFLITSMYREEIFSRFKYGHLYK